MPTSIHLAALLALGGCLGTFPAPPGRTDTDPGTDTDTGTPCEDPVSWYADADGDGYGGEDAQVEACEQPDGFAEIAGDCDDGDASIHPAAIEICNEADDDCDGDVDWEDDALDAADFAFYPDLDGDGYGDPSADVALACTLPADHAAEASDCDDSDAAIHPGAEEVCGNGVDDDCVPSTECRTQGSIDLSTAAAAYLYGDEPDDYIGWFAQVSAVADFDGDGSNDFAVSGAATTWKSADANGVVYLLGADVSSGRIGARAFATLRDERSTTGQIFGSTVQALADFDGDGVDDLLAGTHNSGALVMLGPLSGEIDATAHAAVEFLPSADSRAFGYRVAGGEFTGDTELDVVVADLQFDEGADGSLDGRVYVFEGPLSASESTGDATAIITAGTSGAQFGGMVTILPDLDGDGAGELAVKTTYEDVIHVFLNTPGGTVPADDADIILSGDASTHSSFGSNGMGEGCDLDDDGYGDLLVAYRYADDGAGEAWLFRGSASGFDWKLGRDQLDATFHDASTSETGHSARCAGDLDGDGGQDLVVGSASKASILFSPVPVSGSVDLATDADAWTCCEGGTRVTALGDLDGDGLDDLLVAGADDSTAGTGTGSVHLLLGSALYAE